MKGIQGCLNEGQHPIQRGEWGIITIFNQPALYIHSSAQVCLLLGNVPK